MDRLQQAIQKARIERAGRQREPLQVTEKDRVVPVPPNEVADSFWTALPELELDKKTVTRNRLMSYESGSDAAPYDMLRTKMLQQITANGWRRVALTSPHSECGKSTTTANLAFSLGRQRDLRVIVIDFDLRRRGLAEILNQTGTHNMVDVICGDVAFEDHAIRHGDNVIFGLNYSAARNPSEVLQSRRTIEMLEQIETVYNPDIVLFDAPPLMASDDTHGILKNMDCALMLAEAEKTSIDHIDLAERQLAELTNVMGIVLNKCRYAGGAFGHEYGTY